jgi:hypothetical protein
VEKSSEDENEKKGKRRVMRIENYEEELMYRKKVLTKTGARGREQKRSYNRQDETRG